MLIEEGIKVQPLPRLPEDSNQAFYPLALPPLCHSGESRNLAAIQFGAGFRL
jgi:hypothetical protein